MAPCFIRLFSFKTMLLRMLPSVLLQTVIHGHKSGCNSKISLVFIIQPILLVYRALERSEVAFSSGSCPRYPGVQLLPDAKLLSSLILKLIFRVRHLTFHTLDYCCLFVSFGNLCIVSDALVACIEA